MAFATLHLSKREYCDRSLALGFAHISMSETASYSKEQMRRSRESLGGIPPNPPGYSGINRRDVGKAKASPARFQQEETDKLETALAF
jgi:hypothetical protein